MALVRQFQSVGWCTSRLRCLTIGWIALISSIDIHGTQRMHPSEFGNWLTFPLQPQSDSLDVDYVLACQ